MLVCVQREASTTGRRLVLRLAPVLPLVATVVALSGLLLRPADERLVTAPAAPSAASVRVAAGSPDGQTVRLRSGARDRAVLVEQPTGGRAPRGVVLVLGPHGLTATRAATDLHLDAMRARGYVVAYPSTLGGDWNAGRCCGEAHRLAVDDVAFLRQVRDLLAQRAGAKRAEVGLVGYSTGGQMAYRLLCDDPGFASAAVIVSGSLETTCTPPRRLPATLIVHGLIDSTIPWAFTTQRLPLLNYQPTPALASIDAFATAARCGPEVLDTSDGRSLMGWPHCAGIALLSAVGMPETGHGWASLHGSVYATRFLTDHLARP